MGISLEASWETPIWFCVYGVVLGYTAVVRDLKINQHVKNVTLNGSENTTLTIKNLRYLRNFSIVVLGFNDKGLGPASSPAVSSTFEAGN